MTEFEADGRYSWGALFTGYDGNLCLIAIRDDFNHLPRMLNYYCREYVEHKGRRVERDKIRPQIKEILIDLYGVLNEYGEDIVNYIEYEQPLKFGLLELNINKCKYIFQHCRSVHPDSDDMNFGIALFGYLLRSFYLHMDSQFLPSEVRDTCLYMGENIIKDYYSLAKVIVGLWKNTPISKETRVFIGLKEILRKAEEQGCKMFQLLI